MTDSHSSSKHAHPHDAPPGGPARPRAPSSATRGAWNLPNAITGFRVLLIIPVLLLVGGGPRMDQLSMSIFVVAALLDAVDGQLARRWGQVTFFGTFVDPLADKVMVAAVLVYLVALGRVAPIWVALILAREFYVSGLRMLALRDRIELAADVGGKLKTALQLTALALLIGGDAIPVPVFGAQTIGSACLLASVVVSIWSAVTYTRSYGSAGRSSDD